MPYKDPEKQKAFVARNYQQNKGLWRERARSSKLAKLKIFDEWKRSHPCTVCGESDPVVIDAHHPDPGSKDDGVSNLIRSRRSDARIIAELDKCVSMCSNCHRRHHWNERNNHAPVV